MNEFFVFLFLLPPLIAVLLSFYAESKVSLHMLRWIGSVYLVTLTVSVFLVFDCRFNDYTFCQCRFTSESAAHALTAIHYLNLIFFVSLGPLLFLVAIGFELRKRFGKDHRSAR